jgi:hypothetical protein
MTDNLNSFMYGYAHGIIIGYEVGMYDKLSVGKNGEEQFLNISPCPFFEIYKDIHELFFTKTYNSLVQKKDKNAFDSLQKISLESKHSIYCLLHLLSQITTYIHFNLNRETLNVNSLELFKQTLDKEIKRVFSMTDLNKLTNHKCEMTDISMYKPFADDGKFLNITLKTTKKN